MLKCVNSYILGDRTTANNTKVLPFHTLENIRVMQDKCLKINVKEALNSQFDSESEICRS
jgi:hypothetical protein